MIQRFVFLSVLLFSITDKIGEYTPHCYAINSVSVKRVSVLIKFDIIEFRFRFHNLNAEVNNRSNWWDRKQKLIQIFVVEYLADTKKNDW